MVKIEEKGKVGRPKLADKELIKDSWYKVAAGSAIAIVMIICLVGIITERTPWQVLTFKKIEDLSASTAKIVNKNNNTKNIPAKKATKRIINTDGTITNIIPANPTIK